MKNFWSEFVGWIDSQISVKDGLFYSDLRWLMWLPGLPFFLASLLVPTPSTLGYALIAATVFSIVPWTVFLFHRRKRKKRNWVEPDRWYDDTNGY